jgi:hypothetical protein
VWTVASNGLVGSSLEPLSQPLDTSRWKRLLQRVHMQRLAGLLASAIDDGELAVTPDQAEEAHQLHATFMQICLELEADLLEVADIFDRSAVRHRVLKGPAVAHLDYPDPALRVFGDIDILVPSAQFDTAAAALAEAGYSRKFTEVRPGFDHRFGKGASFRGPNGHEIDLHRTFVMGPYGLTLDLDDVWQAADRFEVAGRSFETLDADQRFLHACYHAALGNVRPGLVALRDLAGMLQRTERPIDVDRVLRLSAAWRSQAVVARALCLAWEFFALPETPLARWARDFSPGDRDREALRTYLDPEMGYAARSYVALRAIPGIRSKAAFAWALALPDRTYGSGRHRSRLRRWRAAIRQILAVRRRPG